MNKGDLRSKETLLIIIVLLSVTTMGFSIPITAHLIDEQITIDSIGIDQSASIGLGVIMIAPTLGIGMALVTRRRATFDYYNHVVCRKTHEPMYEDDEHERIFCPTHGEQDRDLYSDDKHYVYDNGNTSNSGEDVVDNYKNNYIIPDDDDGITGLDRLTELHDRSFKGIGSGKGNKKKDLEIKITELESKLDKLSKQLGD